MIKTEKHYHKISNGIMTWFFYEAAVNSVLTAYIIGDVDKVYDLSILVTNNFTNKCEKSNWPHRVTNEFDLGIQLERDNLNNAGK